MFLQPQIVQSYQVVHSLGHIIFKLYNSVCFLTTYDLEIVSDNVTGGLPSKAAKTPEILMIFCTGTLLQCMCAGVLLQQQIAGVVETHSHTPTSLGTNQGVKYVIAYDTILSIRL